MGWRFTEKINNHVNSFTPAVSDKWHIDEQMVKTKHTDEFKWVWNVIDNKTKFLIANNVTDGKSIREARQIFRGIKENFIHVNQIYLSKPTKKPIDFIPNGVRQ